MIVHTGAIVEMSSPAAWRRARPRSTASATASAWGTVKQTVALIEMPAAVTSSTACTPARVAGIFTCMFGARPPKWTACLPMRAASR